LVYGSKTENGRHGTAKNEIKKGALGKK